MILGIAGRRVLVVGGSRGIGLECFREFQSEGCQVKSVSRTEGFDLMPEDGPRALVRVLEDWAPDIVIHALGGSQGVTRALSPVKDWEKVWRLNLGIAIDLNNSFIPAMQQNRWGRIIHISSNAPKIGIGYCPYVSAKAALDGYVKAMSKEFSKDGVIISALAPGIVHTPGRYFASLNEEEQEEYFNKYIPIHRFGSAQEVAKVVVFLASEHAAYMAGSIVRMDGGAR